jgi:serine/threonine protein kinase
MKRKRRNKTTTKIYLPDRKTPFATGANDPPATILSRIGTGEIDVSSGNWGYVSDSAKTLVRKMLDVDPGKRPTAKDVAHCLWIQNRHSLPSQSHPIEYPASLKVHCYVTYCRFNLFFKVLAIK